jgi:hypothetical protein
MYEFVCRPYGVVTLEELYYKADNNSSCQKNIQNFFKKNPLEGYFSENLLKLRQLYHTEFRNTKCILYAKGKLSLSELILKNGLGLKEPNFDDKEFNHLFRNAQAYAKQNKIGLFEDGLIEPSCIEFLKTKE